MHEALERVSSARGIEVPETVEQRTWIERFATIFPPLRYSDSPDDLGQRNYSAYPGIGSGYHS